MNYTSARQHSWERLLADGPGPWQRPLSVRIPIQPAHSPDLVHVDCALNAIRRRVHPNLSIREMAAVISTREWPTWIVQFALGNPPFVPDPRLGALRLFKNAWPVVLAQYLAWDILYDLEYSCRPVDDQQNLLTIQCRVTNLGSIPLEAHIRPRVAVLPEYRIDDDHYVPFNWDAGRWVSSDQVGFANNMLTYRGGPIGRIVADGFDCVWEESASFEGEGFNRRFARGEPYWVAPAFRLNQVNRATRVWTTLKPGASRQFTLQLLTDIEVVAPVHVASLRSANPSGEVQLAMADFKSKFPLSPTTLAFPSADWEHVFTAAQFSSLQLLLSMPGQTDFLPTQGGSSQRHFVWVWEARFMLLPLLQLGHFAAVRKALDVIFSLQDGGYPPEGDLVSTQGSVGTTGPRCLNSTGSAVTLACEYLSFERDPAALSIYLPKILRAVDWIVGELSATRKLNPDGSRPPWYGLMPFGRATDADFGYLPAITDSYTLLGLARAADLLERRRHPRAAEIHAQVEQYAKDLNLAIVALTRPDGYIERRIATGHPSEAVDAKLEHIGNMTHMAFAARQAGVAVLDPGNAAWPRFQEYVERVVADGFFMGPMDREVVCVGVNEMMWQHLYLRAGEWKKAFAAARAALHWGMSAHTHQGVERFSKLNPAYTPWQPNGGGNGRALEMMINAIYFEAADAATILGGVPFLWLTQNGTTRLDGLYTPRGRINVEVKMVRVVDGQRIRIAVSAIPPSAMPRTLVLPDHFAVEACVGAETSTRPPFGAGPEQPISRFPHGTAQTGFPGNAFDVHRGAAEVIFVAVENRL